MLAATGYAQPVVNAGGILNAASYATQGLPNSGIAQGGLFVIFGRGLGPAALAQVSAFPLPTMLAGTSVQVTASGGPSLAAVMVYTSAGQVAAILPSSAPVGPATLTVTYNGLTSAPASFEIVRSRFGIFTQNSRGSGPAVIQNFNSQADQALNRISDAAQPGQAAILWGTGLGPISGNDAAAPPVGDLPANITVLVGNKPAKILYQGRSGCCSGIDQIVFEVPAGVEGCFAPVSVRTDGVTSNFTSMAVASGSRICSDPTGFTAADLAKAQSQGNLKVGELFLLRFTEPTSGQSVDFGAAQFSRVTYDQIQNFRSPLSTAPPGACYGESFNTRDGVLMTSGAPGVTFFADYFPFGTPLDAGASLRLNGPNGQQTLQRASPGLYFGNLFSLSGASLTYLTPGNYSFDNGSGGSDVGAFTANVQIDPPIRWTNSSASISINRSSDYGFTWSGGGANDRVTVIGQAYRLSGADISGGLFVCTEMANAGRVTVPAAYLSLLPAVNNDAQGVGVVAVYSTSISNRFQPSAGLDAGYILSLGYSGALAAFR